MTSKPAQDEAGWVANASPGVGEGALGGPGGTEKLTKEELLELEQERTIEEEAKGRKLRRRREEEPQGNRVVRVLQKFLSRPSGCGRPADQCGNRPTQPDHPHTKPGLARSPRRAETRAWARATAQRCDGGGTPGLTGSP